MQKYLLLFFLLSFSACQLPNDEQKVRKMTSDLVENSKNKPIQKSLEVQELEQHKKKEEPPSIPIPAVPLKTEYPKTNSTYATTVAAIDSFYSVEDSALVFTVDEVEKAKDYLSAFPAPKVMENKLGKQIEFLPKEDEDLVLVPSANNIFLNTVQIAYDEHRPLVLSPDIIWLAICQGVGLHINENFEALKSKLYTHDKQLTLIQRNDSLEKGAIYWGQLVDSLALKTEKYTKADFYDFFVADFSTTTDREKRAYQITLLYTHKKAFKYVGESGCGIPYIRLEGTTEDWQQIYDKLEFLKEVDLEEWGEALKAVLEEFIQASKGEANPKFWKSIYKDASAYGAFYISGWIIKFFPYIKQLDYHQHNSNHDLAEVLVPNSYIAGSDYLKSTLSTDNFPEGIVEVPIEWRNYFKGTKTDMLAFAGFFGIKQYEDKALKAHISWAIAKKHSSKAKHYFLYKRRAKNRWNAERKLEWLPGFANYVRKPAIYDPSNFKGQKESLNRLKRVLLDSARVSGFDIESLRKATLEAEILANGDLGNVKLLYSKDEKLEDHLAKVLKDLGTAWSPAFARPLDADPRIAGRMHAYLIRVNSKVWIKLKG
jgi:hypothetical protein